MAYIRKRVAKKGVSYQVRFKVPETGKERSETFRTRRQADARCAELEMQVHTNTFIDPKLSKQSIQEVADKWRLTVHSGDSRSKTIDNAIRVHIVPSLGAVELRHIRNTHILEFKMHLLAKLKPKSARNILEVLKSILVWAYREGFIPMNPDKLDFKLPKSKAEEKPIPTHDEIWKLLQYVDDDFAAPVIAVCLYTGLRIGEVLGLDVRHVDIENCTIRVEQQLTQDLKITTPKSGQFRTVGFHEELLDFIRVLVFGRNPNEPLWLTESNQRLNYNQWKAIWNKVAKDVGLSHGLSTHSLRHYYASHMLENGASVVQVAQQLGHSSPTITLRTYAHAISAINAQAVISMRRAKNDGRSKKGLTQDVDNETLTN